MNQYTKRIDTERLDRYYTIAMMTSRFSRTESGKSWKARPDSWTNEVVPAQWYYNTFDAVPFFRSLGGTETVSTTYCVAGYLPYSVTSISPDRQTKIVRSFFFSVKTPDEAAQ